MSTRLASIAAATTLAAAILSTPVTAQIPDGWAVGSAFKQFGYTTGGGGVTVFHPHRDARWQVQGLPSDLTGIGVNSAPVHGAYNILIRPSDKRLFVGELTLVANDTLEIHEFSVVGRKAVGLKRHRVGRNDPKTTDALIGEMAWLPDGRILFVHFGATDTALGSSNLAILDPATGKITPVPVTGVSPAGQWNALALNSSGSVAYFAVNQIDAQRRPISTKIYALATPAGGAAVLVGQRTTDIAAELQIEKNGDLAVMLAGPNKGLHRLARSRWTRITPTGVNIRGAFRIDSVTGHYVGRVDRGGVQHIERFDSNGKGTLVQTLPRGSEVVVGIDIMPSMQTYGTESTDAYRWSVAANPGGAPTLGNTAFGLTTSASSAPLPGSMLIGLKPGDLRVVGIRVLIDQIALAMPLSPTASVRLSIPIPNNPALAGVRLYAQTAHARGSTLLASKGLRFTPF